MKLKIIATLFYTFCLAVCGYAQDIYVTTDGNDNNSGSKEKPVATLEAARDLIRQYKATKDLSKCRITVWIGKGQ